MKSVIWQCGALMVPLRTAIHLFLSGFDISLIALWLGHENLTTTYHYVEADLVMNDQAPQCMQEPRLSSGAIGLRINLWCS